MGLRVLLIIAAFAGMIALCIVGWTYGGMGGLIGGALGFLVRLPGRGELVAVRADRRTTVDRRP